MDVDVDGFSIVDGAVRDIDAMVNNVIIVDNLAGGANGFTPVSGVDTRGRVEITNVAGALAGQFDTGQALVLTDLVADMPAVASPSAFRTSFRHNFGPPIQVELPRRIPSWSSRTTEPASRQIDPVYP